MSALQPSESLTKGDRIDGWKSIAAYFGRDRTTVVRWARERGLPVHRVPGGQTGSVFALRGELDAWIGGAARQAVAADEAAGSIAPAEVRGTSTDTRRDRRWHIGILASMMVMIGLVAAFGIVPMVSASYQQAELPRDPALARAYLAARDLVAERRADSIERGLASLERVVARNPRYAPAQVALGEALILSREFGGRSDREAFRRARSAANAALRLDSNFGAAERLAGFIAYWADNDFREADRRFRRALSLDRADAITYFWYGNILSDHGSHAEALEALDRARMMQPGAVAIRTDLAWARWSAGDLAAPAELGDLARRYPGFAVIQECLSRIRYVQGDRSGYVDHLTQLARLRGDSRLLAASTALRGVAGDGAIDRLVLEQALADLAQERAPSHVWAIFVAGVIGERARVVDLLRAADRRREHWGEAGLVARIAARWRADSEIRSLIARRTA